MPEVHHQLLSVLLPYYYLQDMLPEVLSGNHSMTLLYSLHAYISPHWLLLSSVLFCQLLFPVLLLPAPDYPLPLSEVLLHYLLLPVLQTHSSELPSQIRVLLQMSPNCHLYNLFLLATRLPWSLHLMLSYLLFPACPLHICHRPSIQSLRHRVQDLRRS